MPKKLVLPDCARALLEALYPTVDWSRVDFYDGLPWYVSTFSSGTVAVTLPDPVGLSHFRIYFKSGFDFCSSSDIATLVHEAYHVLQFMSVHNGFGFGMWRRGFIRYFTCFFSNGSVYEDNPFEKEAYDYERAFVACYKNPVCKCDPPPPTLDRGALVDLLSCNPALIIREAKAPRCESWWGTLISVILVLLFAIFGFIAHILDFFNCRRRELMRRECVEWGIQTRQECAAWADKGYSECSQWADEGYEACDKWADEGYSTCDKWADEGYKKCCDWKPCVWLCKAWVWISNWVCKATIWVSKMVCKVTVWVSKWVCKATVWITKLVCVLWTTITEAICLVIAWVLYVVLLCWL